MSEIIETQNNNVLSQIKDSVEAVEKEMMKLPQVPCPVVHTFGPGVYLRQVTIPTGAVAIGHHQNFEHMNIMLKGKVSIKIDDGSVVTLTAPQTFVAKPGRKIAYVHEELVWVNVYSTNETDVEKLEAHFLTKSDVWSDAAAGLALAQIKSSVDADDFKKVIAELGLTEEFVREVSINTEDMTELPLGSYKIKVAQSNIEGKGLFATGDFQAGEVIAPARLGEKRTIAGRYTNHSKTPNSEMIALQNGDVVLVATQPILGCAGGIDGQEITVDYKQVYHLNLKLSQGGITCQE